MPVIGELNPDGTVKTEADTCALTGRDVLGRHSVMQQISGTPYYFRYLSDFQNALTAEKMAAIRALIPPEIQVSSAVSQTKSKIHLKKMENE